jgi:peptidoglycan hydrolase CwlO-like protein
MRKFVLLIGLTVTCGGVLAQDGNVPLSLEASQARARFARDRMIEAESKFKAAEMKNKAATKRLDDAKAQAERSAKELQEAQAEFTKARERHDQAYQDLKRAHEALQESTKQK